MQLRRSLIELEDQNVQNSIEVGDKSLSCCRRCCESVPRSICVRTTMARMFVRGLLLKIDSHHLWHVSRVPPGLVREEGRISTPQKTILIPPQAGVARVDFLAALAVSNVEREYGRGPASVVAKSLCPARGLSQGCLPCLCVKITMFLQPRRHINTTPR